jgi:nitrogen regulatory protein P-II 1
MKLIKAYIRHRKTEEVYNALVKAGFCCMTFVESEGTGQYSDRESIHISENFPVTGAYRVVKLEILIENEHVDKVVSVIRRSARTGYKGDGMIILSPVDEVYKVRTNETGILAI